MYFLYGPLSYYLLGRLVLWELDSNLFLPFFYPVYELVCPLIFWVFTMILMLSIIFFVIVADRKGIWNSAHESDMSFESFDIGR